MASKTSLRNYVLIDTFKRWKDEVILTGSRRFGFHKDTSDWDFVGNAEHYVGWKEVFKDWGFVRLDTKKYFPVDWKCKDTLGIWERRCVGEPRIQVVLSKNFEGKRRIIEWLEQRNELLADYYTVPKNQRHKIWKKLHEEMEKGNI